MQQSGAEKTFQPTLPHWELNHQNCQKQAAAASALLSLEVLGKGQTTTVPELRGHQPCLAHLLDKLPQTVLWSQDMGSGKKLLSLAWSSGLTTVNSQRRL